LSWKEGEKKDKEKKERKKERKKRKRGRRKRKKSVRKKREKKKNWIYLESISYLNSDWNLFCALFSKTAWLLFHIIIFTAVVVFTYILLSRATLYPSLMLVVLRRDLISVLGSRL
jgi:hypothetical protein